MAPMVIRWLAGGLPAAPKAVDVITYGTAKEALTPRTKSRRLILVIAMKSPP
jgi:hypothetical protein